MTVPTNWWPTLLCLALVACGSPSPVPDAGVPVLPHGDYWIGADITSSEGTCAWLGDALAGVVHVDQAGSVGSPLEPLVSCVTSYEPFTVRCEGLGARVTLTGRIWNASGRWGGAGTGVAVGDVSGCQRAELRWWLVAYARDGGT
jgi:hypothetical protein